MTERTEAVRLGIVGIGAISQVVHVPILTERPDVDVTEEVIARFNAAVPPEPIDLGPQPALLPEDFSGRADGG